MEKVLILLRGLPGSGKSTFASLMWPEAVICEADQFFYLNDEYRFNPARLKDAHDWCKRIVRHLLGNGKPQVVISNTSTTEKEMQPYLQMAEEFGYRVVSLIVENRHGNESIHGVPNETIQKMKDRFEIKLI
jgi:predicted kinase